jgi:hypothetical protein
MKRFMAFVALALLPTIGHAQGDTDLVTVESSQGQTRIRNRLPVALALHLRHSEPPTGSPDLMGVVAQARGETVVSNQQESLVITRIEPLHPRVPLPPEAATCGGTAAPQADVVAQLAALSRDQPEGADLVNTPEAAAKVAVAVQIAQINHEQRLDQLATERDLVDAMPYDPLNPASFDQYLKARRDAAVNAIVGSLASLAILDLEGRSASEGILGDEANTLDELVVKCEEALPVMKRALDGMRAEAVAHQSFATMVDGAIGAGGPLTLTPMGTPGRLCAGQVRILDSIVLAGSAPADQAVARGKIQFDRGGLSPVLFRRVGDSDRWVAQIAWPPDAAQGKLTLGAGPGGPVFDLSPGRPALASLVTATEQKLSGLRALARARRYRAHGADRFRTLMIP